ncbi:MAG: SdpI family protein [Oscillospiraceae bacterium]|nr:SdpI family protein [Oscillospiraceae bacterium]
MPLAAALFVYQSLPDTIQITPTISVSSGRAGVWMLPVVNVLFAGVIYGMMQKLTRALEQKTEFQSAWPLDTLRVLPAIRVFAMSFLTAVCLSVVYGYYVMDTGEVTADLIGRAVALVPGVGTALFAMQLPKATKGNFLALRWYYTERSQQVWLKTHKLGTVLLYAAGGIMVFLAFFASGLQAAISAMSALFLAAITLYVYAKRLYEDEFYR